MFLELAGLSLTGTARPGRDACLSLIGGTPRPGRGAGMLS